MSLCRTSGVGSEDCMDEEEIALKLRKCVHGMTLLSELMLIHFSE